MLVLTEVKSDPTYVNRIYKTHWETTKIQQDGYGQVSCTVYTSIDSEKILKISEVEKMITFSDRYTAG